MFENNQDRVRVVTNLIAITNGKVTRSFQIPKLTYGIMRGFYR